MSTDDLFINELLSRPRPFAPLSTLQNDLKNGYDQPAFLKKGPNIYGPVKPPLPQSRPEETAKLKPSQKVPPKTPPGIKEPCGRLKVLETEPEDAFVLTANFSNLTKTKSYSRPKSWKELKQEEIAADKKARICHATYPEGSFEANLLAIKKMHRNRARLRAKGMDVSGTKRKHSKTTKFESTPESPPVVQKPKPVSKFADVLRELENS